MKKKIIIGVVLVLAVFAAWFVYDLMHAKPVDPALRDPCSAASVEKRGGNISPFCE